jgi:DNA processing protein
VSGLARGIDGVAHRAALEVGGKTVAVLGSGLGVIYPREHRTLAERISECAAVISEFPLSSPPLPGHFPRRNRIISGLCWGTVVVEAAERSGSLITARSAAEQNREVFGVPGPLGSPTSRGVHRLIQEGAKLVTEVEDILEELPSEIREQLAPGEPPRETTDADVEGLDEDERKLLDAMGSLGTSDVDSLVVHARIPPELVTAATVRLALKGKIRSIAGGFFRAVRPGSWPSG